MRTFRLAGCVVALGMALGMVAGPAPARAKAGPTRGTPYAFGLLLPAADDPFHLAIEAGAQQASGPIDVRIIAQDSWHSGITQKMQVGSLIATDADALLVEPVDADSLRPELMQANAAGIPIIFLGQAVSGVKSAGDFPFGFAEAGQRVCQFLAQRLKGHGKIAILESALATWPASQDYAGCQKGLGAGTHISIVSRQRVDPSRDGGETGLHELLVAHPDLDAVIAETGLMGLGAVREEEQMGPGSHVLIAMIGSGGSEEKQAVKAGKIAYAVMLDPASVGRRAVKAAFHYDTKGSLGVSTSASVTVIQPPGS